MQNRYVGDLGDFGKYGLLRWLCLPRRAVEDQTLSPSLGWPAVVDIGGVSGKGEGSTIPLWPSEEAKSDHSLIVGVVWYLVPNETHNSDGKHVHYLDPSAYNQQRYRDCDPILYDTLREIVRSNRRSVSSIRDCQVLPLGTRFYEAALTFDRPDDQSHITREHRVAQRKAWLHDALKFTAGCDIVFVDPDNGLEVKVRSLPATRPQVCLFQRIVALSGEGPKFGNLPPHRETRLRWGSNSRAVDPNEKYSRAGGVCVVIPPRECEGVFYRACPAAPRESRLQGRNAYAEFVVASFRAC